MNRIIILALAAITLSACVGPNQPIQRVDDHDTPSSHGNPGERKSTSTFVERAGQINSSYGSTKGL